MVGDRGGRTRRPGESQRVGRCQSSLALVVVGGCHAVAVDAEGRATCCVVCNGRRIAVHVPRRVGRSSHVVLGIDAGGRARVEDTSLVTARQPRRPRTAGDEATIFISARMRGCATEDARMRGRFSGQEGAAQPGIVLHGDDRSRRRAGPWLATAADARAGQGKAKESAVVIDHGHCWSSVAATPSRSMPGVVRRGAWCRTVVGSLSTSHVGSVTRRTWCSRSTLAVEGA